MPKTYRVVLSMLLSSSLCRPLPLARGFKDSLPLGSVITVSPLPPRWHPDGVEGALGWLESGVQSSEPDSSSLPSHVTIPLSVSLN